MATFTVELSPTGLPDFGGDGGLDQRDASGNSVQRTASMLFVKNGANLMIIGNRNDGTTFEDVVQTIGDLPFITP